MKIEQPDEYGYQRKLKFTGLPSINSEGQTIPLVELEVQVMYLENTNDGQRVEKAITLDHCIIPLLAKAPAMEAALSIIIGNIEAGIDNPNNHAGLLWNIRHAAKQAVKAHRKHHEPA